MAIDYGTKRVGIAVTDPLQIIASGLQTVPNGEIMPWLKSYLATEAVECIVVGDPQRSDGSDAPIKAQLDRFVAEISKAFPTVKVVRYNEQYSSQRAESIIRQSGAKRKKRSDKALVDTVSAAVILQDYMEENKW